MHQALRSIGLAALLLALGAVAGNLWEDGVEHQTPRQPPPSPAGRDASAPRRASPADRRGVAIERRVRALEARISAETARRQQLEEQLERLRSDIAALADAGGITAEESGGDDEAAAPVAAGASADHGQSAMERALTAAGVDTATAEDIKRRGDELTMAEMYLRDQAAREGWLDTPRFAEEMASIESQRTSVRDEIGDDAYDRYLFSLGHPNRVLVEDVMAQSPAEVAGLRVGDLILHYGGTRIFNRDELVAATRGGDAEEPVRLDIVRNGTRLELEVPRGPLGLRIGVAQDHPDED